jgi:hypothetical protein
MNDNAIDNSEGDTREEKRKLNSNDKFLIAIVIGALLLIVVTVAVLLLRPNPDYLPEDSPSGIAHNYLLALQLGDYERANGYLTTSLRGKPDNVEEFMENIEDRSWEFRLDTDTTLEVESENIQTNRAVVVVRETRFYGGGIFDNSQSTDTFKIYLELDSGEWRIWDADHYFASCWDEFNGCR